MEGRAGQSRVSLVTCPRAFRLRLELRLSEMSASMLGNDTVKVKVSESGVQGLLWQCSDMQLSSSLVLHKVPTGVACRSDFISITTCLTSAATLAYLQHILITTWWCFFVLRVTAVLVLIVFFVGTAWLHLQLSLCCRIHISAPKNGMMYR